jgi:hypothetical protein
MNDKMVLKKLCETTKEDAVGGERMNKDEVVSRRSGGVRG